MSQIRGKDRETIKDLIAILSSQNITPYDLLLSLDKQDIVPDDVVKNRKERILKREGEENPQGYLKNAIEDLERLTFDRKDYVISNLKKILGEKTFSGYELSEYSSKYWGIGLTTLVFAVLWYIKNK